MNTAPVMFNSKAGAYDDESDITIIDPSMTGGDPTLNDNYIPVLDRLKQATNTTGIPNDHSERTSLTPSNRQDYIFVDHNTEENAHQLQQVLQNYIRDLKQENQTQMACAQQLVIRLVDLIRPVYAKDQTKMNELDEMLREIAFLHDKRHVEQNEKLEQLRTEMNRLNKLLFDLSNPPSLSINNRTNSVPISDIDAERNAEHWTEIEDDAKKLQGIIEQQKEHIHELVSLLNRQEIEEKPNTPEVQVQEELISPDEVFEEPEAICTAPRQDSLFERLKNFMRTPRANVLSNHSPGSSPTHSLTNFIAEATTPTSLAISEPPQSLSGRETCPACQQTFTYNCEEERTTMYNHFQECLFPAHDQAAAQPLPVDLACPECERKYPPADEINYIQHLADCLNRP